MMERILSSLLMLRCYLFHWELVEVSDDESRVSCTKCEREWIQANARRGWGRRNKMNEQQVESCQYCGNGFTPEFEGQPMFCSAVCYEEWQRVHEQTSIEPTPAENETRGK